MTQINEKNISCSCIEKVSTVEMSIPSKVIYRFNAIPIKVSMSFFTEIENNMVKFLWNHIRPQIVTAILRKQKKAGGIILPDFKSYFKSVLMKRACAG